LHLNVSRHPKSVKLHFICNTVLRNFPSALSHLRNSVLSTLPYGNIGCYAFDRAKCHRHRTALRFPDIIKLGCVFVLAHFAAHGSLRTSRSRVTPTVRELLHSFFSFSAQHHSPAFAFFSFFLFAACAKCKNLNHGHQQLTSGG
jgi:hypothetical protein